MRACMWFGGLWDSRGEAHMPRASVKCLGNALCTESVFRCLVGRSTRRGVTAQLKVCRLCSKFSAVCVTMGVKNTIEIKKRAAMHHTARVVTTLRSSATTVPPTREPRRRRGVGRGQPANAQRGTLAWRLIDSHPAHASTQSARQSERRGEGERGWRGVVHSLPLMPATSLNRTSMKAVLAPRSRLATKPL